MDWKEGTYFSIAVFGYRGWWYVEKNIDNEKALCLLLKGNDARIFPDSKRWEMRKSFFKYGGRVERSNFLLRLLRVVKSF